METSPLPKEGIYYYPFYGIHHWRIFWSSYRRLVLLGWPDFFLIYRATISAIYIYIYIGTDKTVTRTMVVNIKRMAHVCSNTFLSIFLRRDTIAFWKMSLLHWLTKLTHQTLYREKIIGEVLWRQWCHGDWTLKTVSEIAFCFILATGFKRIVIRTWFTETILVPIIIVSTFISIIVIAVFIILLFLLLLSL